MSSFEKFSNLHFDILKEIGNIGAGNAITALSSMLSNTVRMQVPNVNLLEFDEIADFFGGHENIVVGILVNLGGDINGIMMFIVEQKYASSLLSILVGTDPSKSAENFTEIELSALTEIGNILTSSYLSSLAGLTNKTITPSIPYLAIDMANAILSVPAIEFGKVADKVLFIESVFINENMNVSGYFLLVPDMQSFDVILKSLGVM